MRMGVWILYFEMVRFEIKIICCEIKKSEMTFYCCWMTIYCSWVDILNVLEWECVFGKMVILTILNGQNDQNGHKQTGPSKCSKNILIPYYDIVSLKHSNHVSLCSQIAELLFNSYCSSWGYRGETRDIGYWILCGGCPRRKHQGGDMFLRWGLDQVQPQIPGWCLREDGSPGPNWTCQPMTDFGDGTRVHEYN